MGISKTLYFAAIVPPASIREEIKNMKLEFKERFAAAHAFKLPAHITIIPPVWLEKEKEQKFLGILEAISSKQDIFPVKLKDFGHFRRRSVFVKVEDHEPIKRYFHKVYFHLKEELSSIKGEKFHPHMTLATRDLSRDNFDNSWADFKNRKYMRQFSATGLIIFKHDGKRWEEITEFPFREQN